MVKQWQPRWCIIDHDACALNYYEVVIKSGYARNSYLLKGRIPLQNARVSEVKVIIKSRQFCFKVKPADRNREYFFSTESMVDMKDWVNVIAQHGADKL